MTIEEVKDYFLTGYAFRKATGMSADTFHSWMKKGFVPLKSQLKMERMTNGALKADFTHAEPIK